MWQEKARGKLIRNPQRFEKRGGTLGRIDGELIKVFRKRGGTRLRISKKQDKQRGELLSLRRH